MGGKMKLSPPPLNRLQGQARSTPSSIGDKVKLGPSPFSDDQIFRSSPSRRAKMVEVIDLISFAEDTYDVDNDDEDSDDVLPPPPSSLECCKRKALDVADCSN
jgi:hypothetical protein